MLSSICWREREGCLRQGRAWFDMDELIPVIGFPECIEDVDKPLGRLRMAGGHFVLRNMSS